MIVVSSRERETVRLRRRSLVSPVQDVVGDVMVAIPVQLAPAAMIVKAQSPVPVAEEAEVAWVVIRMWVVEAAVMAESELAETSSAELVETE